MLDGLNIHTAIIADYSMGREMMTSGFARPLYRLAEAPADSIASLLPIDRLTTVACPLRVST
jgi:hypothetical protein